MNVCSRFYDNPSNTLWAYFSQYQSGGPTDITIVINNALIF